MMQAINLPGFSQTQYYEYDAVNRLKVAAEGATIPASMTCPSTSSWCREYGYDHFGNRWVGFSNLSLHMATPTSAAAFQATTNRLTAASYDAAGNLTAHPNITIGGGTITYDANNKQAAFTKTGTTVDTWYDAQDRRVRKVVNGATTIYVYDAFGKLAAEYTTAALNGPRGTFYRTTDHLGSTRLVTDSTGAVLQRRDFFPFGEEIPADSSHGGRNAVYDAGLQTFNATLGLTQQFTGQQRDEETGLDYFWARNYSAAMGRFLSVDPENAGAGVKNPQSWNAYSYVFNSPCSLVDPDGLDPTYPPWNPFENLPYLRGQFSTGDEPEPYAPYDLNPNPEDYLNDAIDAAIAALGNPDCAGLFGSEESTGVWRDPAEVLRQMARGTFALGRITFRDFSFQVDDRGSPINPPVAQVEMPNNDNNGYAWINGQWLPAGANIIINSFDWGSGYWMNPANTVESRAVTLLHELGHVYDKLRHFGSGGSQIPDDSASRSQSLQNSFDIDQACMGGAAGWPEP